MHPEILRLGLIHLRSYGLLLAVAFLVGTWLALREARRVQLDEDRLITVILVTLVAAVLGARALFVLEHIADYRGQWMSVLRIWQGGLTLYGGLAAGTMGGLLTARQVGLPIWVVADALTPSLALGTMIGRVGCFLNGCCYGRPTRLAWGVVFPPDSFASLEFGPVPVHPSQLYFALAGLVLFAILWPLRLRLRTPGLLFWALVAGLAGLRIPLDFTRAYEADATLADAGAIRLTESQLTSAALLLFALLMILRLRREAKARGSAPHA
ncbi:MAG: prolipoprotein diacylglyceryl transferase [Candidatus Eisenbacteria bacterium]|nr:prolipoprotein diacylglyceryl transferase [Candidatus Eisenbacteria bacterium]